MACRSILAQSAGLRTRAMSQGSTQPVESVGTTEVDEEENEEEGETEPAEEPKEEHAEEKKKTETKEEKKQEAPLHIPILPIAEADDEELQRLCYDTDLNNGDKIQSSSNKLAHKDVHPLGQAWSENLNSKAVVHKDNYFQRSMSSGPGYFERGRFGYYWRSSGPRSGPTGTDNPERTPPPPPPIDDVPTDHEALLAILRS